MLAELEPPTCYSGAAPDRVRGDGGDLDAERARGPWRWLRSPRSTAS